GVRGHLRLPADPAIRFGAAPELLAVVRLAARLARQQQGIELGLIGEIDVKADLALLDLSSAEVSLPPEATVESFTSPYNQPLLRELLSVSIENRRFQQLPRVAHLEREVDHLHEALRDQGRGEAERLHQAKLNALAEFAAGAGHEINNPLAVISGQAQYVLSHERDWVKDEA